jgi:hypothetical protein
MRLYVGGPTPLCHRALIMARWRNGAATVARGMRSASGPLAFVMQLKHVLGRPEADPFIEGDGRQQTAFARDLDVSLSSFRPYP